MNANTSFRCAVIGTGSLLVQSAEELRSRGHAILCVASPDPKVASWAATNKVPHVATWADLESAVRGEKVDLLFSIVNDEVLPPSALTLPRVMAINYHDAPLPRYAGIHATSWALMAGEKEHAITWHVMSDRVDFGDILVQEHFGIAPDDNALTLNAKCYAAAQRAFRSLLGHLERGTTARKPQSEAARTFFGRHKRPANAGIIDPNTPAQTLENLGRALDFGVYENPLCAARIWTGDRFIVASSIALAESGPHALPGTIINTGPDWLRMAAADGSRDVRLLGLKELDGTPANLTDSRFAVARTLMSPPADALAEIVKTDAAAHKHEKKWVARLAAMSPIVMPLISGKPTGESGVLSIDVGSRDASSAAALFCAYLARVSRAASFDLLLHTPGQVPTGSPAAALFDSHVPIKIECEPTDATAPFADRVRTALADAERMGSFAKDVAIRFPTLRNVAELKQGAMWHAAIELGTTIGAAPRAAITLRADGSGKVSLVFRREIVGEETARAIAEQFQVLLKSADAGAKTLAGLDFTPAHERARVLETFNATKTPYETGLRLGDLIRRRVKQHPSAPALVFEGRVVSYAELDGMAWGIAKQLRSLGVKPGTLVGVCVDRSVELVAALVGVSYSGGAYVPLDPGYPADRLVGMCQDAKMPVVLTRGDELARAGAAFQSVPGGVQVVRLDDGSITPSEPLELVGTEDDPAYVIFTSGSTGRPKGAMNAHKGIVNRLFWMQEAYQLDGRDRVMQKTPYSFDVSVWEFFWPLITGASIVVAKPEGHRDSAYLVELIKRERVTTMHFVPSMLRVFLEERGLESCDSLRRVVCSGEALPTDLVDRFFTRIPHAKLANLYGPTEAAVDVTSWECKPNQPIVPIGKPIANTRMYVLDQELRPLPVGVPGELYIGGVQVGMGYVSRPELTAERFVTDPHNQPNGRMYKTGDLGRWLPDGSIEYLGRIDDQVKIRGFRIELGEIEQVLSKQPGVKDAVVLAREDVPGTKRLVAYVVGNTSTSDLKAADLKTGLGKHLPEYMVPTAFVFLDHLPVTSNGKLDRRALPAPARGSDESSDRPEDRPSTDVEKTLATIWAEVLRLPTVNATDNFFEIGGDSILGLRIVAKAQDAGLTFAIHDLFRTPTIRTLAAQIGTPVKASGFRTEPFSLISAADRARLPENIVDAYPLSALQGGMVFHSERAIGSYLYQVAMSIHVKAKLDMTLLQRAVDRVVSRHPILRTSFDLGSFSEPMQLVHKEARTIIQYHDITGSPAARQKEILAKWIDDEAEYVFDWRKPPLLTYTVHKRSDETFQFGITFHDAILDGWSTSNMMTEIFDRYVTMLNGGEDTADAPNPITYRDFVTLERSTITDPAAREFWTNLLADAPFTPIPRLPGVGRDVRVPRNLDVIVPIPHEINRQVEEHARRLGMPVKAFYLATHMRVLGMLAKQTDIVTGLVMNGRIEEPSGDRCLGNHLNTMPYRLDLGVGRTWAEIAKDAYESELRALPHRRYIGAQLLRDLGRAGQDNMFETGFNYTKFHIYDKLKGKQGFELIHVDFTDPFHYAFVANFRVDAFDDRLDVVLNYNTKHMTADQVKQIGKYYQNAMRSIASSPDNLASTDSMVPENERQQVTATFNTTEKAYEKGQTLASLIARQAKKTPSAPALVFEGRVVSYAELDGMAWGIAKQLRSLGVKPGTLVGVCVDRSVELVAALVGVSYSGGAYVPLDPGYPADRLVGMCQDAKMPVVLTRGDELARAGAAFQSVPGGVQVVRLDDGPHGKGITPSEPLELVGTEDDPAYVIFTSGSTGRPKGAMNAHKGIVNRLFWMQEAYQLDGRDRVMQKTPYSFDVSVWEFFWPLITGASIVVAKPEGHRDSAYLVELIKRERVTTMHFVPSMLRVFLEERGLESCESLRRVVCSGEALPTDLVDRFFTRIPHAKLANLYGPTEAAVDVTSWECKPNQPIVPIGKPIANTRMYVLDQELRPLPVGVPGELYIGGVQVGMGYVSRPELTAERFVQDPHNAPVGGPDGRMYKTGDLGRWLPDGSIEYLGRIDDQVKIRGFRIELGEIEQVLSKQPGVKDAVVLAREDVPGTKRLVAYVVGNTSTSDLKAADLKTGLGKHLPEYMVPTAFVFLDHLPVTSNGKLDRRALPAPARGSDESSDRPEDRPSTDVEKTLATIWAEVLRLPTVNATDNFFEIGGDSILSIQICAKARKHNILITPNQIFDHPTIVQLSPHVKLSAAAKIDPGPVTGVAALIPIQKWLLEQPLVRPDQWNAAIMLETPADVHAGSIERALQAIVAHHDALRLRFSRGAGGTWKSSHVPVAEASIALPVVMVDRFGTPETDELIQREGGKIQGSLDLAKGPVFSAVLFKARDNSAARLLMVAHHLVLDGLSWRIIVEDLITAHGQASKSQPIALPPKTMSFASWASLLGKHARSPEVQAERAWWAAESAAPAARVKRDTHGANIESSSRVHTLHLDESLTRALLYDAPSAHRAQMNDILLAALGVTLRDATGATRMRIDMMGHGREQIGVEDIDVSRTVGWFTTLFPATLDVGSLDAVGAVEPVRDHLRSIPARGLGYGLLRWMDGADQSLARSENAPISFNYLGQFDQALEPGWNLGVARTRCGPTRDPASPRFYDIEVDVMVVGHKMVVDWTYSANLFKPETIAALADSYRAALVKLSASEPGAGTSSDAFPLAGLSDAGLAKLSALFETTDAQ
ncbi:MAG: amino acid adenylation domain-containing protein [Phycisphaeraceae bacterium]|nr:MAG: amino acid adenylation domain-containing protein [Phycisphaeraceae bacterium]